MDWYKMFKEPHYKNDGDKNISYQVKVQWFNTKIVGTCSKTSLQVWLQ
jgi:hypothetical protein